MNSRYFNSIMPKLNNAWAAKSLGMELNERGIDLTNKETNTGVELKFSLNKKSYTVLEYQLKYGEGKNAYWGFGLYSLDRPIKSISKKELLKGLERMVECRELWVVPWNFIHSYFPHSTKGETKFSKWEHTLRYPKFKDIPETSRTLEVEGGVVHFTQGVELEHFDLKDL